MQNAINSGKPEPDFSMVLGGPLYQLLLRMRMVRPPLDLLTRRIVVISLLTWLPLLALAMITGRAWGGVKVPFLYDIEAHVRFPGALPLLILAELVVHKRFRPVVGQFRARNIIAPEDLPRFDGIIESSFRLRNSVVAEVLLIALLIALGPIMWRNQAAIQSSTWYADVTATGTRLTLPGVYYRFVAIPLFQFILLRWFWRLFIWCRFLWKVSRLNLNLIPTHPDAAGGLGFLSGTAHALAPLLVAQSAVVAGHFANRIFYEGAKLFDLRMQIAGITAFLLLQAFGPLFVFLPRLMNCQRTGNRAYGVLASRYTAAFHEKWITGDAAKREEMRGSADIQSLADLSNSVGVIRSMGAVPFTKTAVLRLAIITLLPMAPLLLTVIPLDQLLSQIVKALL